jgi:hypothetical protein
MSAGQGREVVVADQVEIHKNEGPIARSDQDVVGLDVSMDLVLNVKSADTLRQLGCLLAQIDNRPAPPLHLLCESSAGNVGHSHEVILIAPNRDDTELVDRDHILVADPCGSLSVLPGDLVEGLREDHLENDVLAVQVPSNSNALTAAPKLGPWFEARNRSQVLP